MAIDAAYQHSNHDADDNSNNNNDITNEQQETLINYRGLIFVLVPSILSGLLFGYDIGVTWSFAEDWLDLDKWQKRVLVSCSSLGALVGSVLAFAMANAISRRGELQLAALLSMVGHVFHVAFSDDELLFTPTLVTGRLVYGIGVGLAMHGAPIYMSEMSPFSIRGMIVTSKEAFAMIGIFMGYSCGSLVAKAHSTVSWPLVYGMGLWFSVPMFLWSFCIPYSAQWLVWKRRSRNQVLQSLRFTLHEPTATRTLEQLTATTTTTTTTTRRQGFSLHQLATSQRHHAALLAGLGIIVWQPLTGQPLIVTLLFRQKDEFWGGDDGWSVVGVAGIVMVLSTLATVTWVDRVGRRTLLQVGIVLMCVALITLTVTLALETPEWNDEDHSNETTKRRVVWSAMVVYMGGYQVGLGPIAWLLLSEVFPLHMRGGAVALGVSLHLLLPLFLVLQLWACGGMPKFVEWSPATFGVLSLFAATSLGFVRRYIPETKGLPLKDVEEVLLRRFRENNGIVVDDESLILYEEEKDEADPKDDDNNDNHDERQKQATESDALVSQQQSKPHN